MNEIKYNCNKKCKATKSGSQLDQTVYLDLTKIVDLCSTKQCISTQPIIHLDLTNNTSQLDQ